MNEKSIYVKKGLSPFSMMASRTETSKKAVYIKYKKAEGDLSPTWRRKLDRYIENAIAIQEGILDSGDLSVVYDIGNGVTIEAIGCIEDIPYHFFEERGGGFNLIRLQDCEDRSLFVDDESYVNRERFQQDLLCALRWLAKDDARGQLACMKGDLEVMGFFDYIPTHWMEI